ncbi:MAG: glycosyltransferase [Candidatus Methylacidiphilales bacterium]
MAEKLSIVIPTYRSEKSLPILVGELMEVVPMMGYEPEIILVDDRSPDGTWEVCLKLKEKYGPALKIARLLTNRGQHNATLCGFYLSRGSIVVTMDDDLQNPPSELPKLIEKIRSGYDLVIAEYKHEGRAHWRNWGGGFIDSLLRAIFHLPKGFQLTSFRAAKREVVQEVSQMGQVFPYITAMLLSHSANQCNVAVEHHPRRFGSSNYTLKRSLSLAANLILNYSPLPLVLVGFFCSVAFLVSFVLGVAVLCRALIWGSSVPGWASLMVVTSFFNGVILLSLIIFGMYLIRLYQQVTRSKVRYTVSELHE